MIAWGIQGDPDACHLQAGQVVLQTVVQGGLAYLRGRQVEEKDAPFEDGYQPKDVLGDTGLTSRRQVERLANLLLSNLRALVPQTPGEMLN